MQEQVPMPMDDVDERPRLTRNRMNALKGFPTLKNIVEKVILQNPMRYTDVHWGMSRKLTLKDLATQTVNELLMKLKKQYCFYEDVPSKQQENENLYRFWEIYAALPSIVTSKCKTFVVDWFLALCPESKKAFHLEEMLRVLSSNATGLESLTIGQEVDAESFPSRATRFFKKPTLKKYLLQLTTLTKLVLNKHVVSPADLLTLGKGLPNLEKLHCNLMISPEQRNLKDSVAKMMTKLPRLRNFVFQVWKQESGRLQNQPLDRTDLATFCLLRFPQLKVIGSKYMGNSYHELRPDMVLPNDCQLAFLNVHFRKLPTKEQCLKLPNVKYVKITYEFEDVRVSNCKSIEPLLELRNVSRMEILPCPPRQHLMMLIKAFGPNLEILNLNMIMGMFYGVDMQDTIMAHCPKLKSLEMDECAIYPLPPTLTTLTPPLECLVDFHMSAQMCYLEVELSGIFLAAPNLERVTLSGTVISKEDIEVLAGLVKENKVFTKLEYFALSVHNDNALVGREAFGACCELVKNVCAYAPKVGQVQFSMATTPAVMNMFGLPNIFGREDEDYFDGLDDVVLTECLKLVNSFKNY